MPEMSDVVSKLALITEQGKAPWKAGESKNTFTATFGKLSVVITSQDSGTSPKTRLGVLDETGRELTHVHDDNMLPPGRRPYHQLETVHQQAKLQAVGPDPRLAELLELIDAFVSQQSQDPDQPR